MTVVHWFRRDLRLADNPALLAATGRDEAVVPLFVVDPALWRTAGRPRLAYLAASLRALDAQLGGALVVRTGRPQDVVPAVAREAGATRVHVTAATEPYGRRRDRAVARSLGDTELVPTGSPYAVAPGRLTTAAGTPFQVFTPFRAAWLRHGWSTPAPLATPTWADLPSDGVPDAPATDVGLPAAGERAALTRWRTFLDVGLATYGADRDRPDLDGTSAMSVPLKFGELHPRTLLADLAHHGGDSVATYLSELAWREFHADVLWHHPSAATRSLRTVVPDDTWATGPAADEAFDAWAAGRTGYPLVDAGMRQLRATGWMHNRVRMVVASFLVKDLHLQWQRGAEHFLAWLVDGGRRPEPAELAVGRGDRTRCRALLPRVQPGAAGREVRPGRRLRAAVGTRAAWSRRSCGPPARTAPRRVPRADRRPRDRAPGRAGRVEAGRVRSGQTSRGSSPFAHKSVAMASTTTPHPIGAEPPGKPRR